MASVFAAWPWPMERRSNSPMRVAPAGLLANSVDEAIQNGIAEASSKLQNVEWFEVGEIRGHVENGKVGHFQVTMKVGFRLENS